MMYSSVQRLSVLVLAGSIRIKAGYSSTHEIDAVGSDIGNVEIDESNPFSEHVVPLASNTSDTSEDLMLLVPPLLDWVKQQGGSVHENVEFRHREIDRTSGDVGVFATEFIPKGTDLLVLPKSTAISPQRENSTDYDSDMDICKHQKTARKLHQELMLGPKSEFAPYLHFLLHKATKIDKERLPPTLWSKEGQDILQDLLVHDHSDHEESEDKGEEYWGMDIDLPPQKPFKGSLRDLLDGRCGVYERLMGEDELHAFVLQHALSWGRNEHMIPLYDMLRQRNGMFANTAYQELDDTFVLQSSRNILKGEELVGSHYQHVDKEYGTPELFRDRGFVEGFPQRFIFHDTDIAFELDEVRHENNDGLVEFRVKWIEQRPFDEDMEFLSKQEERITELFFEARQSAMLRLPKIEQRLLRDYHDALVNAITSAMEAYEDESTCILSEGPCTEYDSLQQSKDKLDYSAYTCNTTQTLQFKGYEDVDKIRTQYQNVTFFHHPNTGDTCFDLDQTVQICDSYRPDYHEPAVHYPARYLDRLERALFVGGGDSMLLHELLKYESIKKVVGLELDQQVTRYSFKHFGTQPHWDDDRVEWWFGDASKSLGMLPREYFGSFDLVIVDLSETVMSFRVTDSVDILGALALLLKPKGIMVKNEVYLKQFSNLFNYTMQAIVYNSPVVCSQVMNFGSYENDFLLQRPKEVEVDTLLLERRSNLLSPHGAWHDYHKKSALLHPSCRPSEEGSSNIPQDQTESPGIVMIVDVEEALKVTLPPNSLKKEITQVLGNLRLTVLPGMATVAEDQRGEPTTMVSLVLEEGYIVARAWPTKRFIALDIHLWGGLDKQDAIRVALIEALEGEPSKRTSSAYRIVAGGMFGAKEWEKEEQKRGPHHSQTCDETAPNSEVDQANTSVTAKEESTVLSEALSILGDEGMTVAVVCGTKQESCSSLSVISEHRNVEETVPVWTCPNLHHFDAKTGYGAEVMQRCEEQVFQQLERAKTIGAIVLDSTAPFKMGQVLAKVLTDQSTKELLIGKDFTIMATFLPDDTNAWRRALLDRFRTDIIIHDPIFRAEVLFDSDTDSSSLELGITSSGDPDFISLLKYLLFRVEGQTNLKAEVHTIQGGLFRYQNDYKPHVYADKDYNSTSPFEQWMSQEPMGYQTIFQLEPKHWSTYVGVEDRIEVFYQDVSMWDAGHVTKIHADSEDGTRYDVRLDDGTIEASVHNSFLRPVNGPELSSDQLKDALLYALDYIVDNEGTHVEKTFSNPEMGEGSVSVVHWKGGSLTVLWDGRKHINVNIFTYRENAKSASVFVKYFTEKLSLWRTAIRDEQPRGMGRVVNFRKDLFLHNDADEEREYPHWA